MCVEKNNIYIYIYIYSLIRGGGTTSSSQPFDVKKYIYNKYKYYNLFDNAF